MQCEMGERGGAVISIIISKGLSAKGEMELLTQWVEGNGGYQNETRYERCIVGNTGK
jgi:hypothetical protein